MALFPGRTTIICGLLSVWAAGCHAQPMDVAASMHESRVFDSPDAAVQALLAACKDADDAALLAIFGREHEQFIIVPDQVAQRAALQELYTAAHETTELRPEGEGRRILIIGREEWPFPMPLVHVAAGWQFDTAAGVQEILSRQIGENELNAIAACDAYCQAQAEYASADHDRDEVREYAQHLNSTSGQRDGLYWTVPPDSDEPLSPIGPLMADAAPFPPADQHATPPIPYQGYYYKVLTRQGPHPPGGEYDYVINGNMIAGFALVAWPADYGASGITTFVVSHQGRIYEKDLGEQTPELVRAMTTYDPDPSWRRVEGR